MHLTDETKVLFNPAKLRIISHPYISPFFANQSLFLLPQNLTLYHQELVYKFISNIRNYGGYI